MESIQERLGAIGIVPVIKIEDASSALPLAEALIAGELPVAEITFRTEAAADAISAIAKARPDVIVGAGTVISVDLAKKAVDSGASFLVSPGFNPAVVDWCLSRGVAIVPGVSTPSEVEAAVERGLTALKFFPAEAAGGVAMLDALSGPFGSVRFMPTGGIDLANLGDYARRKNVFAVGGSWMAPADLIAAGNWDEIEARSRQARLAVQGFSFAHVGINTESAEAAAGAASSFEAFSLPRKEGSSSIFSGTVIETMKSPFRGTKGHLGFSCWSCERAIAYLKAKGFTPVPETIKTEGGRIQVAYMEQEIAGFAVHLVRAK